MGGGLRQCGVMSVQAIHALDDWKEIFRNDKDNSIMLKERINALQNVKVNHQVDSNIIFITVGEEGFNYIQMAKQLKEEFNVLVNPGFKNEHIRLVVHKDINREDIDYFI